MEKAASVLQKYQACEVCYAFISKDAAAGYTSSYDVDKAFDDYRRHCRSKACRIFGVSVPKVGNGRYNGAWAFTLTMSPKDQLTVGEMLVAVRKVMTQKSCPVEKYVWYYEDKGRDDNGDPIHPHIHGMYETTTGGRIERKHWTRAWKIWDETKPVGAGFRGGYHRPVRSGEGYASYIKKDGGMCESYGLEETE